MNPIEEDGAQADLPPVGDNAMSSDLPLVGDEDVTSGINYVEKDEEASSGMNLGEDGASTDSSDSSDIFLAVTRNGTK